MRNPATMETSADHAYIRQEPRTMRDGEGM